MSLLVQNRSSNSFTTGYRNSSGLDQGVHWVDESSHSSRPSSSQSPICRKFWRSGNYEIGEGQDYKVATANPIEKNHLHEHPMFLHTNATSHKWVFGAIAELLDNAVDEIQNGATFVNIDKISIPEDGSSALLIQEDDGGGMDPEAIRCCMSFGFSRKTNGRIGRYGNGFKTSTMRLGADVIVFTRNNKTRPPTQSIGLLSYTFLRQMGYDRIVVPMVDYEFHTSTGMFVPILPHGEENFLSNLSMLLQWSPYSTEVELLKQYDDIGDHGTKVIVYNLWLNDDGDLELDFDSDAEDIQISGCSNSSQAGSLMKQIFNKHITNVYHYSLRAYLSILYLRLPQSFCIKLRGRIVEWHNIANDLKFHEFILYRPNTGGNHEIAVVTTIGFLKEAPAVNIHGFNIYHRNRLILPFWCALRNREARKGRGVVGVLEANFIEPTHNKQDFEKTPLFQKLEDRLKQMTVEYWDLHCELIGYKVEPHPTYHYAEILSSGAHNSLEQPALSKNTSPVTMSRKRKRHNYPVKLDSTLVYAADTFHCTEEQLITENQVPDEQKVHLMQQNKKLQLQLLELEKKVENSNLKVWQLKSQLGEVECEHTKLLAEAKSLDIIRKEKDAKYLGLVEKNILYVPAFHL